MAQTKSIFKTRTFWGNVATAVLGATYAGFQGQVSSTDFNLFGALFALINIGLRRVTKQPATFTGEPDAPPGRPEEPIGY